MLLYFEVKRASIIPSEFGPFVACCRDSFCFYFIFLFSYNIILGMHDHAKIIPK